MINPQISIIVPVYNAEKYLDDCIKSILEQDFLSFELLLVDDGSMDNSSSICDKYALMDGRIRVFHQKNQGVSSARNIGLKNALGSYVMFADADDFFLPGAFSLLLNLIVSTNSDIALANSIVYDGEKKRKLFDFPQKYSTHIIQNTPHFALWGYIFKSQIIKDNNLNFLQGLAYSEDRLFIYDMFIHCKSIAYDNSCCYVYRLNPSSACACKDLIKKADSQFWASSVLFNKAKMSLYSKVAPYLQNAARTMVNNAIYDFIFEQFSIKDISILYSSYQKYFPHHGISVFCMIFIKEFIIVYGRKIKRKING